MYSDDELRPCSCRHSSLLEGCMMKELGLGRSLRRRGSWREQHDAKTGFIHSTHSISAFSIPTWYTRREGTLSCVHHKQLSQPQSPNYETKSAFPSSSIIYSAYPQNSHVSATTLPGRNFHEKTGFRPYDVEGALTFPVQARIHKLEVCILSS